MNNRLICKVLTQNITAYFFALILLSSCSHHTVTVGLNDGSKEDLSSPQHVTDMVLIPAGKFIMGSTFQEREYAYRLDEIRGSNASRRNRWFENEERHQIALNSFMIDRNLVTNEAYQRFVVSMKYPVPYVDPKTWQNYGLIHDYETVKRFLWNERHYSEGRGNHPVVLVNITDAAMYCKWRGQQENRMLRLPTEAEWEKVARGESGNIFPWGNTFDARKLNSVDLGPYDTTSIDDYTDGASIYGVLNMAGMVFEWTSTDCPGDTSKTFVKGGSWDDYPGVTRAAARHCRPKTLKHILIGFRCAGDIK